MKQAKIMKIKTIKKRNTTRPGVKMKKKVASHFADWSITEPHVTPPPPIPRIFFYEQN